MTYRVPVKLRKPIQKDYCSCHGFKVISCDSFPYYLYDMFRDARSLEDSLDKLKKACTVMIQNSGNINEKIYSVLEFGLPFSILTSSILTNTTVELTKKSSHCSVYYKINIQDLIKNPSSFDRLREQMFHLKSWKVTPILLVHYAPHLSGLIEVLDLIDSVKNCCSHICIEFCEYLDSSLESEKSQWEVYSRKSIEDFRKMYYPNVSDRTWKIKDTYKSEHLSKISEFCKPKKVGCDEFPSIRNTMKRVRHSRLTSCAVPFGMRPYIFEKQDNKFKHVSYSQEVYCDSCGKELL